MVNFLGRSFVFFAISLFLLPNVKNAAAAVIYEQVPAGSLLTPGVRSDDTIVSFDDFFISNLATVGTVRWIGLTRPANARFRIEFYDSDPLVFGNNPADTPFFETIVTPDVTVDSQFNFFSLFSADLGSRILFDANTRYWISIADLTFPSSRWSWSGDAGGIAKTRIGSNLVSQQLTLFFTLDSDGGITEVPAPASLPLFAVGIIGMILSRRRGQT